MAAEALIVEDAYQKGYADAMADMRKKKGTEAAAGAGNSIPVPIFESIFRKILLGETEERQRGGE